MTTYRFYLIETTSVYKEVEADSLEEAQELAEEFMYSDEMDWGVGEMCCHVEEMENV